MFKIERITVPKPKNKKPFRIKERNGWNSHRTVSPAEKAILDMIACQGGGKYRQIDSGAYGRVYGMSDSPIVYKVGDATDNEGYMAFVKQLSKLKTDNPFFPKVHGMRIYSCGKTDSFFVVAMERLEDGGSCAGFETACNTFEELLDNPKVTSSEPLETLLGIKITTPPALQEAVKVLRKAYKSGSGCVEWDLHDGNFMVRGGKQLVVIDPLA